MTVYYRCPDCSGTSGQAYPDGSYENPRCDRCGRNGALSEDEMTPEEIEADLRFWEEDSEARNRVDFGP